MERWEIVLKKYSYKNPSAKQSLLSTFDFSIPLSRHIFYGLELSLRYSSRMEYPINYVDFSNLFQIIAPEFLTAKYE